MEREDNAPVAIEEIATDDVSRAVDRAVESDRHRQRTLRGVPAEMIENEKKLADRSRRTKTREKISHLLLVGGAFFGYLSFGAMIYRIFCQRCGL